MKRYLPSIVWFGAGAVFGLLADGVLFRLWSKVGILLPIGHWLDSHGGDTLVKCWFVLWVNATAWFLAAAVGFFAGRFVKRQLVRCLLAFGIGFAFVPIAIDGYLYSDIPRISGVAWHVVSLAVVVLCGLLFHRPTQSPNQTLQATAAAPGN
jgi:hypothetical protein